MRCTEEAGAVAVEFALVLPILILLVFGSVEFGLALYNKEVIANAGREGARAGIIIGNPRPTATQITTVVKAYLTGAGLNATQATVTVKAEDVVQGCPASGVNLVNLTVAVAYPYSFIVLPNFITGFGKNITLSAQTIMQCE
jgi:Flp pilus assembly protein TadG